MLSGYRFSSQRTLCPPQVLQGYSNFTAFAPGLAILQMENGAKQPVNLQECLKMSPPKGVALQLYIQNVLPQDEQQPLYML